jgi:hypothetical protein
MHLYGSPIGALEAAMASGSAGARLSAITSEQETARATAALCKLSKVTTEPAVRLGRSALVSFLTNALRDSPAASRSTA